MKIETDWGILYFCDFCGYHRKKDELFDWDGDLICNECLKDFEYSKIKDEIKWLGES